MRIQRPVRKGQTELGFPIGFVAPGKLKVGDYVVQLPSSGAVLSDGKEVSGISGRSGAPEFASDQPGAGPRVCAAVTWNKNGLRAKHVFGDASVHVWRNGEKGFSGVVEKMYLEASFQGSGHWRGL